MRHYGRATRGPNKGFASESETSTGPHCEVGTREIFTVYCVFGNGNFVIHLLSCHCDSGKT